MKAVAFLGDMEKQDALLELGEVFGAENVLVFKDWNELEQSLAGVGEDTVLLDYGKVPSGLDVNNMVKQLLERLAESEADLLILLDSAGDELGVLKIFRAHIWKQVLQGLRSGNILVVSVATSNQDYDEQEHAREAETYRDRIGERLFHPERVTSDLQHLVKDDIQRTEVVLSIPVSGRVLDVGCSDGSITIEMAKRWHCQEVIGVDIASSAIQEAKDKLSGLDTECEIHFVECSIEDLVFPDESFDTIVATETLEHLGIGQLHTALGNLVRMLRADGLMIVTVPNRYPHVRYKHAGRARWKWSSHHHFFTQYSLQWILGFYFRDIEFLALYPEDEVEDSIYLIANCRGKRDHVQGLRTPRTSAI